MPWTLYRYILKDIIRLLVISSVVLVLVISFAASVRHLNDGVLDAWLLVKFVGYSIPTMLMFVLPFAAAFASTLVFSRMASDNEIIACCASGMGYRSILAPVWVLGFVLTIGLYYLSNWVVPWFFLQTQKVIQQDLPTLVVSQIQKGRPFEIPDNQGYLLHADGAQIQALDDQLPRDGGLSPYKRISFQGLALGRFDAENRLREQTTAQQADLYLYRQDNRIWAKLHLKNAMPYLPESGMLAQTQQMDIRAFELPRPFKDSPRFLSWRGLAALNDHPERYDRVFNKKVFLAKVLARELMLRQTRQQLDPTRGAGQMVLYGRGDVHYVIAAASAKRHQQSIALKGTDRQPVRIAYYVNDLLTSVYEAPSGDLEVKWTDSQFFSANTSEPYVQLQLFNPTVLDMRRSGRASQKKPMRFAMMHWSRPLIAPLLAHSARQLSQYALQEMGDAPKVSKAVRKFRLSILGLRRTIFAQFYERAALAVTTLLVLTLGAVLSMYLRGQMPLVVYFWSFLLASLAVFIARSGENMASEPRNPQLLSFIVIWLGNLLLVSVIGIVFWRLKKN